MPAPLPARSRAQSRNPRRLATIAGLAVSILALFESRAWLVLVSVCIACLALAAVFYARKQRLAVGAASTAIDGYSIDSLNMANLRRRVNKSFVIQEACHSARIAGEDMAIEWKYSGYGKAARSAAMEFSIDADIGIAFQRLDCVAYDLGNDPEMAHAIRPLLIGTDGLSKKISVPFLTPVDADQPFAMLLKCTLPRCVRTGFGYYISTLSFAQARVPRCETRLVFTGQTNKDHVVLLTRTSPSVRSRSLAHIQKSLIEAGVPVLTTELNERDAFKAVFAFDVTLDQLDPKDVPNLDKAKLNVMELAQEVVARLMAQGRGPAVERDEEDGGGHAATDEVESAA